MPRLAPWFFLVLLLGTGALAGCLGPMEPPGQDKPSSQPATEGGPTDPSQWSVGDSWRYAVSGTWVAEPGFLDVGVVESKDGYHHVAGDDPQEWARAVAGAGGLLMGRVDAESLAPVVDGAPRDLFGFDRGPGETWDVVLWGMAFTLQRTGTLQIEGTVGHRTAGASSEGWTLFAEYNEQAGWFSRFDLRDRDDRMLLGYRLVEKDPSQPAALQSWRVLETHRVTGFPDRMGYLKWESDGDADRLVVSASVRDDEVYHQGPESRQDAGLVQRVRGLLDGLLGVQSTVKASAGSAVATVLSPDEERVFQWRTQTSGMRVQVSPDEPGAWHAVASTGGPMVELSVHRVRVVHHD